MYPFQRTPSFALVAPAIAATILAVGCRDIVSPTSHRPTQPSFAQSGTSAEIRGTGSIGTGSAMPGSARQDFDFDITSDLAGSLTFTDWSVVRPPTGTGKLTVSASDPATYFVAFRDGSSACADATHGVEVDGTGRLDTGVLISFTLYVCDNGPSGSGADFIRFYIPSANYDRNGNLSSGDLVKSGTATATSPNARMTGQGSIGPGTQTVGSNRQDFTFDANATPGGSLRFTDWAYALTPDSGQYVTVDPVNDPATAVTSFQQTTANCVRFAGISRVNNVSTYPFYLDACDNSSTGTGFDTFTITVPDLDGQGKTFRESGTLTSGDVALSGSSAPTTGTLTVTTTTTGTNLDPDGYTVTVDGTNSSSIADNGSHSFANLSSGSHSVTLSGVAANCTVSGGTSQTANVPAGGNSSVAFQVNCVAPPATQLAFTVQPSNAETSTSISPAVKVTALDASGNAVTSFNGSMTMAIGQNPGGGTLSGTRTVTAVNGVGTFSDLKIDRAGNGYTLQVGASGLTGAESAQFNVKQKALICILGVCM